MKVFYTPLSCDIKSCFGVCYTPASYPRRATNFATGCHFLLTNFCFSLEEDVDKVWSKKNKVIDTTSAPIGTEKNFATHSRDQSFPLFLPRTRKQTTRNVPKRPSRTSRSFRTPSSHAGVNRLRKINSWPIFLDPLPRVSRTSSMDSPTDSL